MDLRRKDFVIADDLAKVPAYYRHEYSDNVLVPEGIDPLAFQQALIKGLRGVIFMENFIAPDENGVVRVNITMMLVSMSSHNAVNEVSRKITEVINSYK